MGFPLFLYNVFFWLGLFITLPALVIYLLTSPKARSGFFQKLSVFPDSFYQQLKQRPAGKKSIWFHAVSVGEFNAIRPLINDLQDEFFIIVSTTTRTGQELAKRVYPDFPVFYFPYDLRPIVHRVIQRVQPDLIILTETELWPNLIDITTRRYQIPLILINGRISQSSFAGYKLIKPLIDRALQKITHLYLQSQLDVERITTLAELPSESITVTGNLKFDIHPVVDPVQKGILAHLLNFSPKDTILTFASTHSGEDQPLIETYMSLRKDFPELKLVIAPRHPERTGEIKTILNAKALHFSVRSQLSEANPNQCDVVVLDSIGELLTIYDLSTVAVMGGSFVEKGGQNPIEPISLRVPVIFGPHMKNFREITRLILENNAGYQVPDTETLMNVITQLLTQPEIYSNTVENGQQLLANNRGAKEILATGIRHLLQQRR